MSGEGKTNGKVTNLDYLLKLSKGNQDFVRDMIRIFLEENPGEIRTLGTAISSRDYKTIGAAAHKLRSTVPFVGIDKIISEDISEVERMANEQGADPYSTDPVKPASQGGPEVIKKIEDLFQNIRSTCERAYAELQEFRPA